MLTRLLNTTWLRFQSFPLVYAGSECYADASTTSNSNESNVSLLTTAVMVDNLAKKVDECPLNRDRKYCLPTIGTTKAVRYTE